MLVRDKERWHQRGPWAPAGAKLWEVQLPEKGRAGGEQAGQTPLLATGGDTTNPENATRVHAEGEGRDRPEGGVGSGEGQYKEVISVRV